MLPASTVSRSASGCVPEQRADHHAHRARRGARQGPRARARRRRLHHEAVLDPRVPQPYTCAAPARGVAAPRGRARGGHRAGELRIDVPRRTVEVRGEPVQLTFIEFEMLVVLAQSPGVVFSRASSSSACAGAPTTASRARSTSTSATCARRSSAIRAIPSSSSRCAAPATASDPSRCPAGRIRVRIVLVLVGIVAGALGTAYIIVVPSLERRLVDARLDQLEELAVRSPRLPEDRFDWPETRRALRRRRRTRAWSRSTSSRRRRPAARRPPDSRTQARARRRGRGRARGR